MTDGGTFACTHCCAEYAPSFVGAFQTIQELETANLIVCELVTEKCAPSLSVLTTPRQWLPLNRATPSTQRWALMPTNYGAWSHWALTLSATRPAWSWASLMPSIAPPTSPATLDLGRAQCSHRTLCGVRVRYCADIFTTGLRFHHPQATATGCTTMSWAYFGRHSPLGHGATTSAKRGGTH